MPKPKDVHYYAHSKKELKLTKPDKEENNDFTGHFQKIHAASKNKQIQETWEQPKQQDSSQSHHR